MPFKCDECDYFTYNYNYIKEHKEVVHEGAVYRCRYEGCPSTFTSKNNIWEHIKSIHEKGDYPCTECESHFPTKRKLKVHIGLNHREKSFSCKQCTFKAGFQFHVNRHVKKVHLKTIEYKCDQCDEKFKDQMKELFTKEWSMRDRYTNTVVLSVIINSDIRVSLIFT